jgi:hypothetical protein
MKPNQKINQHFIININGVDYLYVYIRKNACSAWKRMFVAESIHQEAVDKNLRPIEFMNKFHRASTIGEVMAVENRIVILRDPLVRVYSAFINQIVMRMERQYALHKAVQKACSKPIGKVTFEEFVNEYILKMDPHQLDGHFQPQNFALLPIDYKNTWELGKLHSEVEALIGKSFADRYFLKKVNSTEKMKKIKMDCNGLTIRQIFNQWNNREVFPDFESLINSECREKLLKFYSDDIKLLENHKIQYVR